MKSNTRKVLLGAATLAAVAVMGDVQEANAATAKVSITAQIIKAISIAQTKVLQFGKATVKGTALGTVVVSSTADTRSATGGVSLVGGNTAQRGGFKLVGAKGFTVDVYAATKATLVNGTAQTMKVTGFELSGVAFDGTANKQAIAIPAGTATVANKRFGATLNVNAGQATGNYSGKVVLTANYQ